MDKQYLDKLRQLRQRVSIGIQDGLAQLEAAHGDLNAAEANTRAAYATTLAQQTDLPLEAAHQVLERYRYDPFKALRAVEDEKMRAQEAGYQETELLLKRHGRYPYHALEFVAGTIARANSVERDPSANYTESYPWLRLDALHHLNPYQRSVLTMVEWLEFDDYEKFDYALYFYLPEVVEVLENNLRLPGLAGFLRTARARSDYFFQQRQDRKIDSYMVAANLRDEDPTYRAAEQGFDQSRPLLIDTLLQYVKDNLAQFP